MRRAFNIQLLGVTKAMRVALAAPNVPGGNTSEQAEILFANLRKMLLLEDRGEGEGHVLFNAGVDDAVFDRDFQRRWLMSCGFDPDDVEIEVTGTTVCICGVCSDANESSAGWAGVFHGTSYHVHWRVGDTLMSVGIFGPDAQAPDRWLAIRGSVSTQLSTPDDFKLIMGYAIDDALHECQLHGLDDAQLANEVESRARNWIRDRIRAGTAFTLKAQWIERIRRIECSITVVGGAGPETIKTGRQLQVMT